MHEGGRPHRRVHLYHGTMIEAVVGLHHRPRREDAPAGEDDVPDGGVWMGGRVATEGLGGPAGLLGTTGGS